MIETPRSSPQTLPDMAAPSSGQTEAPTSRRVTLRAFLLGTLLAAVVAALNCWIATVHGVHFFGGVQMPFGAVFVLLFLVLFVNGPLRMLRRQLPWMSRVAPVFSATEMLTVYAMLLFAATLSTPGCDNFFMTTGTSLFYFTTPENNWASTFYQYVPSWFAPGWDGQRYQRDVIDPLYLGGLSFDQIPWHAWAMMLTAWSTFLLLCYAALFFMALMFRRQWIEHEALAFPLVQLPLQMLEVNPPGQQEAAPFWTNRTMWVGLFVAAFVHLFKGMNAHYPDWPALNLGLWTSFTEQPWDAIGRVRCEIWLGGVGIAYLLTREISLSFWFFYLFLLFELPLAEMLGFPTVGLPKDSYLNRPTFISYQSTGGWAAMALLLIWAARPHLLKLGREAIRPTAQNHDEPFSPRFVVGGFCLTLVALLAWCHYAGINLLVAATFLGMYLMLSLVLTRLVIEGGFLFPQVAFSPLEWMTNGVFGAANLGAANLTKLSFMQPMLMGDMRTNVLPSFLHTMKIAAALELNRREQRRLLFSVVGAIVLTVAVTIITTLYALYSHGGLASYSWFTSVGPNTQFSSAAALIKAPPAFSAVNTAWMGVGAVGVWLLTIARGRFLWFPLHPLGYIVAPSYPVGQLWFSFFLGWAIKTLTMKYGGSDSYIAMRPFMIGLILGNLCAMMFWMIVGFRSGVQIPYWPA